MEETIDDYVISHFSYLRDFIVGKQGQLFELSSSEPFTVDARYESRNLFFRSLDRSTPVKEKKNQKKKKGKIRNKFRNKVRNKFRNKFKSKEKKSA